MRVLITGSNRGLGLEFVRQLVERGDRVFATCRNPQAADALHELRDEHPDQVTLVALDAGDPATIDAAYDAIQAETDGLELLINNAGIGDLSEPLGNFDQGEMLRRFAVNAVGPVLVLQRFIDLLRAGDGAKVVNLTSGLASLAERSENDLHTYSASKAALNMYIRGLSFHLQADDIPIIVIDPGWVQTDMGGPQAEITPPTSIRGMLQVINKLTLEKTGRFFHYSGREIPW